MKRTILAGAAALALSVALAPAAVATEDGPSDTTPTCASAIEETDGSDTVEPALDSKDGRADYPEHKTSGQPDDDGTNDPEGAPDLKDGDADSHDGTTDFRDRPSSTGGVGDPDGDGPDTVDKGADHDGYLDFKEQDGPVNGDSDDNIEPALDTKDGRVDYPEHKTSGQPDDDGTKDPEGAPDLTDGASDKPETDGSDSYQEGECDTETTTPPATGDNEGTPPEGGGEQPTGDTPDEGESAEPTSDDAVGTANSTDTTAKAQGGKVEELAYTGVSDAGVIAGVGAGALLIGGGALLLARRLRRN